MSRIKLKEFMFRSMLWIAKEIHNICVQVKDNVITESLFCKTTMMETYGKVLTLKATILAKERRAVGEWGYTNPTARRQMKVQI